jgi:diguanylate cyclase (GGDEF)-like protein/PAS domain S-box-containing protein
MLVICLSLSIYSFKRKDVPGAGTLAIFLLVVLGYTISYLIQSISKTYSEAMLWYNIAIVSANMIAPTWLLFSLLWTGQDSFLLKNRRLRFLLYLLPILVCISAWTNDFHGLYGSAVFGILYTGISILDWDFNFIYWIGLLYSYTLVAVGIICLVRNALSRLRLFFHQSILLIVGAIIPIIFHIAYLVNNSNHASFDFTPFSFLMTGIIWAIAIYLFHLLNILPIAHKNVFKMMSLGMIILDNQNKVIDINPAALLMLQTSLVKVIGRELPQQISSSIPWQTIRKSEEKQQLLIQYHQNDITRLVQITIQSYRDENKKISLGAVLLLQDVTQQQDREKELLNSEARLQLAQSIAKVGIWDLDLSTKQVWASDLAYQIYGLEKKDTIFSILEVQKYVSSIDRPYLDFAMEALLKNGEDYDVEFRIHRANDNEERIIHSVAKLAEDAEKAPVKITGVIQDITEFKKIENALQESESSYRFITENMGDVIWMIDPESFHFKYISPSIHQLLGYSFHEIMNLSIEKIFTPESFERYTQKISLMVKGFNSGRNDLNVDQFSHQHKDGNLVWTEVSSQVVLDVNSGKTFLIGTARNITDRKTAEIALTQKTSEFENIFNLMPDLLTIANTDGFFLRVSPSWEKTLGYTEKELLDQKFLEFIHPDDIESTLKAMQSLSEQKKIINFINRYRCKDGSYRWIEWHSQPQGKLIYAAARDITDRKKMEERLQYQSTHDPLTSLYNRQYYELELERLQGSRQFPISLMVIDMNGLKKINDEFGHSAGDIQLRQTALLLKGAFRPEDVVARIGGDEFVIILPNTDHITALEAIARVRITFDEYNLVCPPDQTLSIAIGIATGEHGANLKEVFRQADLAMYQDKRKTTG